MILPAPLRIHIVFGTRPEAIKLLPLITALRGDPAFDLLTVVTGQHRQMLDETLGPFGVKPDVDLNIMQPGQTLNQLVSRLFPLLDDLYARRQPDVVIVQGDTTSAFCAALAAFHRRVAVGHVEAGLRTNDRFHPYPEEVNRRMITPCADLHFAPTALAQSRLRAEGVPDESIFVTGNTAIDTLALALRTTRAHGPAAADVGGRTVLVTLHRREAWGEPGEGGGSVMDEILRGLRDAAHDHPQVTFVFPVHLNPNVRTAVQAALDGVANIHRIEPQPYLSFVRLMADAAVIVTDSGGVQEEGPSLGVPVLVLRKTTERPEALQAGNTLVGTAPAAIRAAIAAALARPHQAPSKIPCPSPFGDGRATPRIRQALLHFFHRSPAPAPYDPTQALAASRG